MRLRAESVQLDAGAATLKAAVDVTGAPHLDLAVLFYESGIARIRMAESDGKPPRWEVRRRLQGRPPRVFVLLTLAPTSPQRAQ
jgi:hypothetical protein